MTKERRRYFRLDDTLGVSYHRLSPEEAKVFSNRTAGQDGAFDYVANFDNRIQALLEACRIQNPVAAELIGLMNKKLNFVIQQMELDAGLLQKISYELKQVSVSACGLAFNSGEVLERNQLLQLDLLLQPEGLHIVAMAKVIDCEPVSAPENADADNGYFLRLDFVEINPHDQELLIQHVVKRQSIMLKERRRTREN